MSSKSSLLKKIQELEKQLSDEKEDKELSLQKLQEDNNALQEKLTILESSLEEKNQQIQAIQNEIKTKDCGSAEEERQLRDKGYQTLRGFKLIPPLLKEIIGRPFMITVAEEFQYNESPAFQAYEKRKAEVEKSEQGQLHMFRDEFKEGYSFRVSYFYGTRDYEMNSPNGKIKMKDFMFPSDLLGGGVEISSQYRSALYLAIHERKLQSAVLPESVFGSPLLSYAFPIFDEDNIPIGAISFSNDITQIVKIARSLGDIVSTESDTILKNLANVLKEELNITRNAAIQLKEESLSSQKTAKFIRTKGREIIDIAERLKVLALNTAIEATKVGVSGRGVSVISEQMRNISEVTRKTLQEIFKNSQALYNSSHKVFDMSSKVEDSSANLQEESSVLFDTSLKLTSQKDDLAALVRLSIDEIARTQEDLNKIFMMLK